MSKNSRRLVDGKKTKKFKAGVVTMVCAADVAVRFAVIYGLSGLLQPTEVVRMSLYRG